MLMMWQAQDGGGDSNAPSHAATPTASFPPALTTRASELQMANNSAHKALNKKRRPVDKDEEDEGKPKRSKITYARE